MQGLLTIPLGGQNGRQRTISDLDLPRPKFRLKVQAAVDRRIKVDCSKSIYEVCKDLLEFVLAQSESLDIICRPWAPGPPEVGADLPSWIPKLSRGPL